MTEILAPENQDYHLAEVVVADIYHNGLSPQDKEIVERERDEVIDPQDLGGKKLYEDFRRSIKELQTDEGYQRVRELGRDELRLVQPDILEQLLAHYAPLLKNMTAGHGKGHALRDLVNVTAMMQDPELELEKIDEVELFVGCVAAAVHDLGNSIVERYDDVKRVGAHAEVGAVLFGNVAHGVIPPNLTLLIQDAIAKHTHYIGDREVTLEDGSKATQEAYLDDTSGGGRQAIWTTRQADRLDTANIIHTVRDVVVRVESIQDFNGTSFEEEKPEDTKFLIDFGLAAGVIDKGLISHEVSFAKNIYRKNVYNSNDSQYFTQKLMTPGVGDLILLLSVIAPEKRDELLVDVEENNPAAALRLNHEVEHNVDSIEAALSHEMADELIAGALSRFKNICRAIEPAEDLEERLEMFTTQFSALPREDQEKWARGFLFMDEVLIPRWKSRMADRINENPHLGGKITSQDLVTRQQFEEFGTHLQAIAQQVVEAMSSVGKAI